VFVETSAKFPNSMGASASTLNAHGNLNVETISAQYLDLKTCQKLCGENLDESLCIPLISSVLTRPFLFRRTL
jgi:hypothetical protein